jgi:hypothetical protein
VWFKSQRWVSIFLHGAIPLGSAITLPGSFGLVASSNWCDYPLTSKHGQTAKVVAHSTLIN